jgi:hypothetical protein
MPSLIHSLLAAALALPSLSFAQPAQNDQAAAALLSVFQRDNGRFVCSPGKVGVTEMKALFAPHIEGIDASAPSSYPALAKAVYVAFPCPFSTRRAELAPVTKEELAGAWIFADASQRLRHPPRSPAWQQQPGVPQVKCEGILFEPEGEYRVMQVRGQFACPTRDSLSAMKQMPRVSSWNILPNGRIQITRTDMPSHFEEWEILRVQAAFSFASVNFAPGDLVAYLRREPGNDIGASTVFRHLQPLH